MSNDPWAGYPPPDDTPPEPIDPDPWAGWDKPPSLGTHLWDDAGNCERCGQHLLDAHPICSGPVSFREALAGLLETARANGRWAPLPERLRDVQARKRRRAS